MKNILIAVIILCILPSCRTRKYGCGLSSTIKVNVDGVTKFNEIKCANSHNFVDTSGTIVFHKM